MYAGNVEQRKISESSTEKFLPTYLYWEKAQILKLEKIRNRKFEYSIKILLAAEKYLMSDS